MTDREVAYEQNVEALANTWADRIDSFANTAVEAFRATYTDGAAGLDRDGLQFHATEVVTARLLDSERWANVKATDISDIAYEAVCRKIDSE